MFDDLELQSWISLTHDGGVGGAPLLHAIEAATEQGLDQEAEELRSYIALGIVRWRR